jgi:sialate O-acetylesterase
VEDFKGEWKVCTPKDIPGFSAVGYYFGRELHNQLGVPIGLIDDSWGGSACEAWIRRDRMEGNPLYDDLIKKWDDIVKNWDAKSEAEAAEWKKQAKEAKAAGKKAPPNRPLAENPAHGNFRPANLYHGRLEPVMPYAIRGVIWYQGETNAGRAYQYRDMFPLMIKSWREDWKEGEFPFYWVQLADFMNEKPEPQDSAWAELREAQTMTMSLPNSGQALAIDIGEAGDIHPRNKREVGRRLALNALAQTYGLKVPFSGPQFDGYAIEGRRVRVRFKYADGLGTSDGAPVVGFAVAGPDRKFYWADARIDGNSVVVSSPSAPNPVAVRYGWSNNPAVNLINGADLPATPFRTDNWPGITAPK